VSDIRAFAKSPGEVAALHRGFLEEISSGRLTPMSFGIPEIDKVVCRVYPGRMLAVIARPSMMKTTFLVHLARTECHRLMANKIEDKYVLFVSLEETEGQILCWVAGELPSPDGVTMEEATAALARAATYPCWVSGREPVPTLDDLTIEKLPNLSAEQILHEIRLVAQRGRGKPSLILLDYLQIMDIQGNFEQRNLQVAAALRLLRKIAQHAGCPIVVAVQAKEEVDLLGVPIPKMGHSYYSSEVAHVADVMMSLYRPWRNDACQRQGYADLPAGRYPLSPNLLWVQLLKQRHGEGMAGWPIWADPESRLIRGIYERD